MLLVSETPETVRLWTMTPKLNNLFFKIFSLRYLSVDCWGYNLGLRQKVIFSGWFLYYYCLVSPFVLCFGDSFHLSNTFFLKTLHFVQFYFQNKHTQVLWKLFSDRPSWALSVLWFASVPQTSFLQKSFYMTYISNICNLLSRHFLKLDLQSIGSNPDLHYIED